MDARREDDVKTALVAIAKNEGPYIREWVLYHKKVCGFDDIFVYDNDSSDETKFELEELSNARMCKWKEWPRSSHNPPQQLAYRDSLLRKQESDWICFMDIDEFLVLRKNESIGEFVSDFSNDTGSVSFNWILFYSLAKNKTNESVIKRTKYCVGDTHVKTIARTKAIKRLGIHTFGLLPGFKYMHCSGAEYKINDERCTDAKICRTKEHRMFDCGFGHINHYAMKSEEEVLVKDERGDATRKEHIKKPIKHQYYRLISGGHHNKNNNIETFIESRYGLNNFYEEINKK